MSELKTSLKLGSARIALTAAGGGAGIGLGLAAFRALQARPEFLPQLVNGGFLGFAAVVVGMVIVSRKADAFTAMHERTVVAQEKLAANVGALVAKDDTRDTRMQALEAAMRYVAEDTRQIIGLLKRNPEVADGR